MNLTDLSDEPLQSQISRQIRAKILSGELDAGFMLPSTVKTAWAGKNLELVYARLCRSTAAGINMKAH